MAAVYIQAIVGAIMIIAGWILKIFPPREMNMLYGYRTGHAYHSKEAWDFAQKYSAKAMFRSGAVLFMVSPIYLLIHINHYIVILASILISLLFVFAPIFFTERALRKNFPTDSKIN